MSTKVQTLPPPRTGDLREKRMWDENQKHLAEDRVGKVEITFIVQTPSSILDHEQALSALASGYMKVTTVTGVIASQAIPIPTTDGGTGLVTYTLGDLLYSSAANVLAKLAGNTTATRKILTQTGTGTASADPAWNELAGTTNRVTVTAGSGTLTLSTPQDTHTGASPTFANMNLGTGGAYKINSVSVLTGQAAHEPDAAAVSSLSLAAGTGTVNRTAFNTALGTLTTEINAIKTTLNNLLSKLEGIGLVAAS